MPRAPTGSSCFFGVSFPISGGRNRSCCRSSARAFNSPSAVCRGAMRRSRRCRAGARPARFRARPPTAGRARSGSTRSGRTASSSRTPPAISSSAGRSGTRSCSARISWRSIPTIRRSTSGSSTITCMRFTSSRTTVRNWSRPSARPKCRGRTARISTARRFWRGFRTALFSCPTGITERAWRSSIRTANSCSTGERKRRPPTNAPVT